MSNLRTIEDIKIPYPVEGVVRTAQLDDTIAPQDSVQLAVNMNFDRVGAIQTRLGVTQYADDLADEVKSFGSLRNRITPDGYDNLLLLGALETVSTATAFPRLQKINDSHVLMVWAGVGEDGFAQVLETDLVTGGLIPIGTPLEFDTDLALYIDCIKINANNYLVTWTGSGFDAFAQVLRVNTTTYAVTAIGTPLEFDTASGRSFSLSQVDTNHFSCFYQGSTDGLATVLEVDLSTYTVTEPGATLTFEPGSFGEADSVPLGDGTRVVVFWTADSLGKAQVFEVNTGTWAITAIGTPLSFATNGRYNSVASLGDIEHVINCYGDGGADGTAQVFNVDPSTYAVTAVGAPVVYDSGTINNNSIGAMGDGENFVNFWVDSSGNVYAQILNIDPVTFDVTAVKTPLFVGTGSTSETLGTVVMGPYNIIGVWKDDAGQGEGAMYITQGDGVNQQFLYASSGEEIFNLPVSGTWTSRRSGLAEVSKPRFSQFLNYIWMVNGNKAIGGDPVATSDGGAFGNDLVPDEFPPGDFIHAGFEGRVWVVDKTASIVYYTDIIQFTPPDVYSLTFDINVNFITSVSPQTGESFTALHRVPRALLLFTQNNIFRIYGATSLDAYPAYNVGTFSQESIIETKTGIFFHHSSGFYQFDYGSQPVEISRKIIDFVKAIPRSYYGDVKGVYDGFDTVQWYVGPVTVEGVVFSNCALRYTISTQVWTIYDYKNNNITAEILYDNGVTQAHLIGTVAGKIGALDTGKTDFGEPFYYEYIDRWRSFTDMYYKTKALNGVNLYSENAAGANISYQIQKSGPNAWKHLATVDERNNALFPTEGTDDFDVLRLRVAGNTKGEQVVIHGMEIPSLTIKGQEVN